MAVILRSSGRGNSGRVLSDSNALYFPRIIYQRLGSLVKNKRLLVDIENGNIPVEFENFINELEKLGKGESVSQAIIDANEYLGSLGISATYSYSKDYNGVPNWVGAVGEKEDRGINYNEYNVKYLDNDLFYTGD